jgi:glycosyltransferase involved in cell wall biosynthesis
MVSAFAALGHEITVLTARRGPETAPLPADIIKITAAVDHSLAVEVETKAHYRERYALDVGEAIHTALVDLHASKPVDLIYERYCLFSTAGTRAAKKIGTPCALEVNSPLRLEQARYRKLLHDAEAEAVEREVFNQANAVFAVSTEVRDYVMSRGCKGEYAHVLPNGVDSENFRPDIAPEGIDRLAGRFVLGFVGSLKPWHGIEYLMSAFHALAQTDSCYHLMIVGDGPLRGWIEGYAAGAGITDQITITGWAEYARLPGLLTAMDVAVAPYPALDDFYFSPLKLYEYMAAGLPVVASHIGQIANVINDGHNGILVKPGDAEGLMVALERLRCNRHMRKEIGKAARSTAEARTWQDNAKQVINTLCPDIQPAGAGA